ncbi:MAG: hypothetical protein RLZZ69_3414 [Cyanobacteriota bacterium]
MIEPASCLDLPLLREAWDLLPKQKGLSDRSFVSLLKWIAKLSNVSTDLILTETEDVLDAIYQESFAIAEDNAVDNAKKNVRELTLKQYSDELVVSLINCEMSDNIGDAIAFARITPFKHLKALVEERIKFLNRDAIAKEERGKEEEEQAKEVLNSISDGTFYDGLDMSKI